MLMLRDLFTDRKFYSVMLKVALPIAAQSLVFNLLNAVDVLLIGQLGETSVAAVALSNQWTFLMNLFLFGVGQRHGHLHRAVLGPRRRAQPAQGVRRGPRHRCARQCAVCRRRRSWPRPWCSASIRTTWQWWRSARPSCASSAFSYVFTALTTVFGITLRTTRNVKLPVSCQHRSR